MKPILWVLAGFAIVVAPFCYQLGKRDGKVSAEEAARRVRIQVAQDSALATAVTHARTLNASAMVDSFAVVSRRRQEALGREQQVARAAADSLRIERARVALTLVGVLAADSLAMYRDIADMAALETAHLEAALDRSDRKYAELQVERDSIRADRDRLKEDAVLSQRWMLTLSGLLAEEQKAHECTLLDLGIVRVGCPPRPVIAIAAFAGGAYVGYKLAKP